MIGEVQEETVREVAPQSRRAPVQPTKILHLWIRGFELPQPTKSNQPPISLLAHGCTRKLHNKEAKHSLLIPGCLSAINHQKLSIPSHPGGSLIKLFLVFTNQYFEKTSIDDVTQPSFNIAWLSTSTNGVSTTRKALPHNRT